MHNTLQLPPQPKLFDFHVNDYFWSAAFMEALAAWERVCKEIISSQSKTCPLCAELDDDE